MPPMGVAPSQSAKTMQRANKDALEKLDPNQVYHTFPDRREGSKSSLILKKPKTKKSNRILYMTKPLKEELLAWLEKLKQDEQNAPEKYSNCGQLFRLPDGLPIAPELLTKWLAVSAPGVRADRVPWSAAFQCHLPALAVGW